MSALVMVEGLPGSGRSTTAHGIAAFVAEHLGFERGARRAAPPEAQPAS